MENKKRRVRGSFTLKLESTEVQVVYSDESGLGSIKDEPVTVVTAIMLNMDSQWEPVSARMAKLVKGAPRYLLDKGELKGSKLFQLIEKKRDEKAVELLTNVLSVPIYNSVFIFNGAVDRAGFAATREIVLKADSATTGKPANESLVKDWSEADMAFNFCVASVDTLATTMNRNEKILWIADHSAYEQLVKKSVADYQELGHVEIDPRTLTLIGSKPTHIVDTVYFGHSHESLALQLADVICATVTRFLHGRYYGRSDIAKPYFYSIRGQIISEPVPMYTMAKP